MTPEQIIASVADRPGPHYQGDVRDVLDYPWDLMIAHPPCTHLSVSGARHFAAKRITGAQQAAASFFLLLARATPPPNRHREPGVRDVEPMAPAGPDHPTVAIRARRDESDVPMAQGVAAAEGDHRG